MPTEPYRRTLLGGRLSAAQESRKAEQLSVARSFIANTGGFDSFDFGGGAISLDNIPETIWIKVLTSPNGDWNYAFEQLYFRDDVTPVQGVPWAIDQTGIDGDGIALSAKEINQNRSVPYGWYARAWLDTYSQNYLFNGPNSESTNEVLCGNVQIGGPDCPPGSGSGTGPGPCGTLTIGACIVVTVLGPVSFYNTVNFYSTTNFFGPVFVFDGFTWGNPGFWLPVVDCVFIEEAPVRSCYGLLSTSISSTTPTTIFSVPFTVLRSTAAPLAAIVVRIGVAVEWSGESTAVAGDHYATTLTVKDAGNVTQFTQADDPDFYPLFSNERRICTTVAYLTGTLTAGSYTASLTARRITGTGAAFVREKTCILIDPLPVADVSRRLVALANGTQVSDPWCLPQTEDCCAVTTGGSGSGSGSGSGQNCLVSCPDMPLAPSAWTLTNPVTFPPPYDAFNTALLIPYKANGNQPGCIWQQTVPAKIESSGSGSGAPLFLVGGLVTIAVVGAEIDAAFTPYVNGLPTGQSITYKLPVNSSAGTSSLTLGSPVINGSPPAGNPPANVTISPSADPHCSPVPVPGCLATCASCPAGVTDIWQIVVTNGMFSNPGLLGVPPDWETFNNPAGFSLVNVPGTCTWKWSDLEGNGIKLFFGADGNAYLSFWAVMVGNNVTYRAPLSCAGPLVFTTPSNLLGIKPKTLPGSVTATAVGNCSGQSGSGTFGQCSYKIAATLKWDDATNVDLDLYGLADAAGACYWNQLSAGGLSLNYDAHPECAPTPISPEVISGIYTQSNTFRFWYANASTCPNGQYQNFRATQANVSVTNTGTDFLLVDGSLVPPGATIILGPIPYAGYNVEDASSYGGGLQFPVECVANTPPSGSGLAPVCAVFSPVGAGSGSGASVQTLCCTQPTPVQLTARIRSSDWTGPNGSLNVGQQFTLTNFPPPTTMCGVTNSIYPGYWFSPIIYTCVDGSQFFLALSCNFSATPPNWGLTIYETTDGCVSSSPAYSATVNTDPSQCLPFTLNFPLMTSESPGNCPEILNLNGGLGPQISFDVLDLTGGGGIGSGSGSGSACQCSGSVCLYPDPFSVQPIYQGKWFPVYGADCPPLRQRFVNVTLSYGVMGQPNLWKLAFTNSQGEEIGGPCEAVGGPNALVSGLTFGPCVTIGVPQGLPCGPFMVSVSTDTSCCPSGSGSGQSGSGGSGSGGSGSGGQPAPNCCGGNPIPGKVLLTIPNPPGGMANNPLFSAADGPAYPCTDCATWPNPNGSAYVLDQVEPANTCSWQFAVTKCNRRFVAHFTYFGGIAYLEIVGPPGSIIYANYVTETPWTCASGSSLTLRWLSGQTPGNICLNWPETVTIIVP